MKRLIFAIIMALIFFVLLNFVYCNLDGATFAYEVIFKFNVPYLFSIKSVPIPMGFVILITFCLGMITVAVLEALPSLFKTLEIRSKNKKIRQLERELTMVRQISQESEVEAVRPEEEEGEEGRVS